jgi:hypothetical protein
MEVSMSFPFAWSMRRRVHWGAGTATLFALAPGSVLVALSGPTAGGWAWVIAAGTSALVGLAAGYGLLSAVGGPPTPRNHLRHLTAEQARQRYAQ